MKAVSIFEVSAQPYYRSLIPPTAPLPNRAMSHANPRLQLTLIINFKPFVSKNSPKLRLGRCWEWLPGAIGQVASALFTFLNRKRVSEFQNGQVRTPPLQIIREVQKIVNAGKTTFLSSLYLSLRQKREDSFALVVGSNTSYFLFFDSGEVLTVSSVRIHNSSRLLSK